jgi:hypothetical protein
VNTHSPVRAAGEAMAPPQAYFQPPYGRQLYQRHCFSAVLTEHASALMKHIDKDLLYTQSVSTKPIALKPPII